MILRKGHVLVLVLTEIILPYVVGDGDGDAVHLHYHLEIPAAYYLPWGSGRAQLNPELIC